MLQMEYLRSLTMVTVLIRILLALLLGGMIGLERGSKHQAAGFRTYMLVCLGAALVMMTNQYVSIQFGTGDPSRMGAQVISGIGFLGAGSIIVTKRNEVRGLTTAAGLWSAACLGLAIGIGFYEGAIVVGIVVLLIMTVLKRIENFIRGKSSFLRLYTNFASVDAMNELVDYCSSIGIKVLDMQISKIHEGAQKEIVVIFLIKVPSGKMHTDIIRAMGGIEGLKFIEEI